MGDFVVVVDAPRFETLEEAREYAVQVGAKHIARIVESGELRWVRHAERSISEIFRNAMELGRREDDINDQPDPKITKPDRPANMEPELTWHILNTDDYVPGANRRVAPGESIWVATGTRFRAEYLLANGEWDLILDTMWLCRRPTLAEIQKAAVEWLKTGAVYP